MTHERFIDSIDEVISQCITDDEKIVIENILTQYDADKMADVMRSSTKSVSEIIKLGFRNGGGL